MPHFIDEETYIKMLRNLPKVKLLVSGHLLNCTQTVWLQKEELETMPGIKFSPSLVGTRLKNRLKSYLRGDGNAE